MKLLVHDGRAPRDVHDLLVQLRSAGIDAAGGERFGAYVVVLIDRDGDAEHAIALLAKWGIVATRG
jgi:hypothetical protein